MIFNFCCKIVEAQITNIDCENILGLWKIFKLTIGTKKINSKKKKTQNTKIYVVWQQPTSTGDDKQISL